MSRLNVGLALIAGLVLVLSLGTGLLRSRGYLPSEQILAALFGVLVGPAGLGLLSLTGLGDPLVVLEQVARLTVAIAVTSIALRLPPDYYRENLRTLAVVLGPVMVFMWLASAAVAWLSLPGSVWLALLIGAVVTPTDPVLANAIVVGQTATENIPERLRYLLSSEAGINDGAAYPFVFLPIFVMQHRPDAAVLAWVTRTLLWEVLGAVVLGAAIGAVVGRVERWASSEQFVEDTSVFTVVVAMTFAVLGVVTLLGSDGILAVFVAGVAYNWQADPSDEADAQRVEEVFNRLFTLPIFVFFGMAIPWAAWAALGWAGVGLVVGVLLVRRLPAFWALRGAIDPLDRPAAALFVGWFGPIGVAAVFYATLAVRETGSELPWTAASLVVAGSLLAHGLSATPLTHWYGGVDGEHEST
ncbi:sodium/proton antiporter, CPA1 family [Halomicrobium zhouii]|uniref:Sodium/proton antiporter, CPA1 family n=1 Tax=Halomicrobium zhouii TaxID=767519 RepID=A0A1I6L361_9EURY|nr:cation:proton antiporter [Halomicrobium zhouii]SFR97874.1 sodium/proton antiporter, CPA1 family [Halomicrobium zhouii]